MPTIAALYNYPLYTGDTTGFKIIANDSGETTTYTVSKETLLSGLAITGSNTFKGTQTFSGSLVPVGSGSYDLGSATNPFRHLYLSSASLYIDGQKVLGSTSQELQITTDNGQSIKILEAGTDTITLQSADGDIQLKSSGGGNILIDPTSGLIDVRGSLQIQDGYKIKSSNGASVVFDDDIIVSGSANFTGGITVNGVTFSSMTSGTSGTNGTNGSSGTSGSNGTNGSSGTSGDSIFAQTGSFWNTSKNVQITGSLLITQNLTVLGSSSITYVTSSQLRVDDNIITLNTSSPGQRFGGIEVYDSGSVTQATGSILWDSVNNRWVYQQSSEAAYGGGVLMSGPRSSGSLGSELTLTSNRVAKSAGGDHLNDSVITDDGTIVSISGSLVVTGSILSTVTSLVSGSSQIVYSGLTGIPSGIVSGSSQIIYSGLTGIPSGIVSGSSQVLNGTTIHSGSFFNGISVISGSAQVDVRSTTNFATVATTGSNIFVGNQIITGSLTTTTSITGSNAIFTGGTLQVGNLTTNATLKISGDNGGGDTYLNFQADSDAIKAQIIGSKNGANGGMLYLRTLQSGTVTTAVTVNQLGNTIFAGTITENSSIRYKENVETIKYGLDKVLQMRGVTYDKKDNGVKEMGVIAEEVFEVLPEVVLKNEEGDIDSVSYGRIVGVLIEAIKDLKKEIEDLKSNK